MAENNVNDLMEAGKAAAIKIAEERLLAKFVGNGTIESGIVKFFLGGALGEAAPAGWKRAVKTAFIMDAAEDIVMDISNRMNIPILGGGSVSREPAPL